ELRPPVDAGRTGLHLEDHIGLHADDGIAPPDRSVLHGFEQERVLPALRQLEIGANRRLEVGHDATPYDLRLSSIILLGEALKDVVAHRLLSSLEVGPACRLQAGIE